MSTIQLILMRQMLQVKSAKREDQVSLQMSEKCTNGKPSKLPNISTTCHMYGF